jgi:acetyltransferase-like isoleucine patch superfamily enzyme
MQMLYRLLFALEKRINQQRTKQIKALLKFCGKDVFIDSTCHILIPGQMEIGDNSSISSYTTVYAAFGVKIGSNCLISSNCGISSINHIQHSLNRPSHNREGEFCKSVIIGNNVWIGMNTCILPGVKIGDNSIIGAGSVVTKNIPGNEVWVGNPAHFVKKLNFENAT